MFVPTSLGLLISVLTIGMTEASPLARIHVKFVQPPYVQEHGITTDGARLVEQKSYLSIGRKNSPMNLRPEYLVRNVDTGRARYAAQRSYPVVEQNDLNVGNREYNHQTPDFSNGLDYPDPLLLTGDAALMAVKYLYGKGEFFFSDIPHERALLMNQELRRQNNLNGNLLGSLRPGSPWYRRSDI